MSNEGCILYIGAEKNKLFSRSQLEKKQFKEKLISNLLISI